ncbi:E3 ubiquitin-protein ligase TRIM45-like [Saccostrea cucullata]|uniref:E3 ubiquitin-protein ligase TRIM45-like n=1 Tax=Saccostrea cuccullata TaxID=36930 RepID=UPI002ED3E0EF
MAENNVNSENKCIEEILKCPICLEKLREPRYLPCLHTFCTPCLRKYIAGPWTQPVESSIWDSLCQSFQNQTVDSLSDMSKKHGFLCPVCRKHVDIDKKYENREVWIEQIPTNHFMNTLLDKLSIEENKKQCDPCFSQGSSKLATSWCLNCHEALCQNCEQDHKKFRLFRNHMLSDLKGKGTEKKGQIIGFIPCPDHGSEDAQIFCHNHRSACCTICATIKHRACQEVTSLKDAALEAKESSETKSLIKRLTNMANQLKKATEEKEKFRKDIESESSAIKIRIEEFKEDAKSKLDGMCSSLQTRLQFETQSADFEINNSLLDISRVFSRLQQHIQILEASISQGSNEECLIELETVRANERDIKNDVKESLLKNTPEKISLEPTCFFQMRWPVTLADIRVLKSSVSISKEIQYYLYENPPRYEQNRGKAMSRQERVLLRKENCM